jgi:hypothetical protein
VADGNICRLAGSGSRIRATGTAVRDGHIWPVAGDGYVTHQRTIPARNVDTLANTADRPATGTMPSKPTFINRRRNSRSHRYMPSIRGR